MGVRGLVFAAVMLLLARLASAQGLTNPGFEAPYAGSSNTIVANGWAAFRLSQNPQFLQSTGEKMEGGSSQEILSNGTSYHAGVYQQISGCTPGVRYRAAGWICTSYDHAYSVVRYSPDGVMTKWLGVDPYGGTSPTSGNIIWSWDEPMDRRWRRLMIDFTAQSSTVTIFAKVNNTGNIGYDITWFDVFELVPSSFVRVSNVGVHPGTTTATITWTTDLASDSKVRYWKWQTTDPNDKNPTEVSGPSGVTQHAVTLTGLSSDRKYYYEVVSKTSGTPATQETIAGGRMFSTFSGQGYPTLRQAKNNPNGTRVYVNDLVVTAGTDQLTDCFYVQQPDRQDGIRVEKGEYGVKAGDVVCVNGTLATVSGERRLTSTALGTVSSGAVLQPLAVADRCVGGGPVDSHNPGIPGASGPNNTGVLVTVWGRATAVDAVSKYAYLDDGSGFEDGTSAGRKGLRVSWSPMLGGSGILPGKYVVVTGLSSCFESGGIVRPQVMLRSPADVRQF